LKDDDGAGDVFVVAVDTADVLLCLFLFFFLGPRPLDLFVFDLEYEEDEDEDADEVDGGDDDDDCRCDSFFAICNMQVDRTRLLRFEEEEETATVCGVQAMTSVGIIQTQTFPVDASTATPNIIINDGCTHRRRTFVGCFIINECAIGIGRRQQDQRVLANNSIALFSTPKFCVAASCASPLSERYYVIISHGVPRECDMDTTCPAGRRRFFFVPVTINNCFIMCTCAHGQR
jgi:hypothetical protein